MRGGARIALLVMMLALLAGAIYGASKRDVDVALLYLCLAVMCGTFERILAVGGGHE